MDKELALHLISSSKEETWSIREFELAIEVLINYAESDGLLNEELQCVAAAIDNERLSSLMVSKLLRCLVPEEKMPEGIVAKVLTWIFSKVGKIGSSAERVCFRWFVGLLQYNLCEQDVFQKYYHDFLFSVIRHRHLEVLACIILHYLSQPWNARYFVVKPLASRYAIGTFSQLSALLSLLKSYRPEVITINVPSAALQIPQSSFDKGMKKAVERSQLKTSNPNKALELTWKTYEPRNGLSRKEARVIPTAGYIKRRTTIGITIKPCNEFKNIVDLGRNQLNVPVPTQTMSLLANEGGFHLVAFSSNDVKMRLLYNLEETLSKVILLEKGPYSLEEKRFLLVSVAALQDNLLQTVSVVSKFLLKFLLSWDGFTYKEEVFALIEWFSFETIEDWGMVSSMLRVYFRSANLDDRCSMLQALTLMVRNLVSSSMRARLDVRRPLMYDHHPLDVGSAVTAVGILVEEVIVEALTWCRPHQVRRILSAALDFYQSVMIAEEEGDLPVMLMVPAAVVYNSLLSTSRLCIERVCSLLLNYHMVTRERLCRLGVFEDFETFLVERLGYYVMDCYRALFSGLTFQAKLNPGMFTAEFLDKLSVPEGVDATKLFLLENSLAWLRVADSILPVDQETMPNEFPATYGIKQLVESQLAIRGT